MHLFELETRINLVELAEYFDECTYIYPGIGIKDLAEHNCSSSSSQQKEAINNIGRILKNEREIYYFKHNMQIYEFHDILCSSIKQSINKENFVYFARMLLNDIDLCIKIFLKELLTLSNSQYTTEFIHALTVSDSRILILCDILDSLKNISLNSPLLLSEVESALEKIRVKNMIILNTSRNIDEFATLVKAYCVPYEYSILQNFFVDFPSLSKLRYTFCYFVIEPSLSVSEYNMIIDTCIKNAITPLFIVYLPSNDYKISKEMFRSRWIVNLIYCYSFEDILEYLSESENSINQDFREYAKYYDNFDKILSFTKKDKTIKQDVSKDEKELDGGFEMHSSINTKLFDQLVEELSFGEKLVGSLHYYFFKLAAAQKQQDMYWTNYAQLFGVTEKYCTVLDVNCSKCLLQAYTLQTVPAFYKQLNDAFRTGTKESVSKFRAFFTMLHYVVKKKILRKYVGSVYRGTYFNQQSISQLKVGSQIYTTCFTSTSKSQFVARDFARKVKRNVLLEIELNSKADTNIDIHGEECSKYPEEEEVLLLPFSKFEIIRIFKEENLIVVTLREVIPDYETIIIKGIEYNN